MSYNWNNITNLKFHYIRKELIWKKENFTKEEVMEIIDKEIEKYNPDEQLGIHDRAILVQLKQEFKMR